MTSNVYVQAMLRVAGASNGKVAVVVGVAVVTQHLPKQDVKGSHVRAVYARDDRSARPPLSLGHESIGTAGLWKGSLSWLTVESGAGLLVAQSVSILLAGETNKHKWRQTAAAAAG